MASIRNLIRPVYHPAYRAWLRFDWWRRDLFDHDAGLPPARLRFRVGEDSDPTVFRETGRRTAENIVQCLDATGRPLVQMRRALDFGCGCGRTLTWLIRQFPHVDWHGCDVDREAIEWCRGNLPGTFAVNGPLPPLPFESESLDLVVGVSVFTHLDEEFQRAWVPELCRVLKTGGILLLSFYSDRVWDQSPDAERIRSGAFVFRTSTKLKGIVPDWYHTALQNRHRVEALLRASFDSVTILGRGFGDHDAAAAIK